MHARHHGPAIGAGIEAIFHLEELPAQRTPNHHRHRFDVQACRSRRRILRHHLKAEGERFRNHRRQGSHLHDDAIHPTHAVPGAFIQDDFQQILGNGHLVHANSPSALAPTGTHPS